MIDHILDSPGVKEGVARAISQAVVYYIDSRKTILQLIDTSQIGKSVKSIQYVLGGAAWSSITAGASFYSYFCVYNTIPDTVYRGCISSITASVFKIPMGNCMRLIQSGQLSRPCLFSACKTILKKNKIKGLYSGYLLNLIEDIIEIDMRVRLYKKLECNGLPCHFAGIVAGMTTAFVTHPFDTLKTRLALGDALFPRETKNILSIAGSLYQGASMRMISNGVKSCMFFAIIDALTRRPDK